MILIANDHKTEEALRWELAWMTYEKGVRDACDESGVRYAVTCDASQSEQRVGAVAAAPHVPAMYTGAFLSFLHERGLIAVEKWKEQGVPK